MDAYGPLCTEFYDADKPTAPADAVEYYRRRAAEAGGPVLEPMCGSGRFLLPLLRAGIDVDGVDAAPAMLEACRRRASAEGLSAALHLQALQGLALPRRYRMAFVPSGSIGLLAPADLQPALIQIRRHLEPGSSLLLECVGPDAAEGATGDFEPRTVQVDAASWISYTCRGERSRDGGSIRYEGRYEKRRGTVTVGVEVEFLSLHLRTAEQLAELLSGCGFDRVEVLGREAYASLGPSGCALVEARTAA